jgi:hypothetical protein
MGRSRPPQSPLEAAAGAASSQAVDAFKLLSNETRLVILFVLCAAYDSHAEIVQSGWQLLLVASAPVVLFARGRLAAGGDR